MPLVALSYMLHTARVNGKTVWCLKNDSGISSISSYDFSLGSSTWTTKKFEWLCIQRAVENKDVSWNSSFSRWASTASREKIHRNRRRCQLHIANCHTKTEKNNAPKSTEQCQSCGTSICREHSMRVCHVCLQWSFILCFIFIVLSFSFML